MTSIDLGDLADLYLQVAAPVRSQSRVRFQDPQEEVSRLAAGTACRRLLPSKHSHIIWADKPSADPPVKATELVLRPSAVEQEFRRRLEQYQGDSEEVCWTAN